MIQIQGWVPWGRGRHSAKSSQEEALVGGRERERNAADYEAGLVLAPFLSALFPSNVGGKNLWREHWV